MDDRTTLASALAGRYELDHEIGRGGMATVYLARDVRHTRRVALKVLNPDLGAVLGAERFLSEIRVTANLQHPNLLPLFDSGEANGLLFYVMPYVEGETLRHRLDREKQLPVDEVVRIASGIAAALDYAHRHGVIHRDLKPENVLLHDGQPLVADFGIALAVSNAGGQRVTQTGLSLGTPQYMSPEQATGDRSIDGRTDIYSLGALTYEMLTGEAPHTGNTAQAVIARLMTEEPRPISTVRRSVPENVEAAVECALQKLPADRFATAKEFGDALTGGRSPRLEQRSAKRGERSVVDAKRSAVTASVIALLALTSITATGAWWRASHRSAPAPTRFTIEPPAGVAVNNSISGLSIAITRDGQTVAFLGGPDSRPYVRRLDQLDAVLVPKAARAADLHFSPDGRWLSYMNGGFNKVPVGADFGAEPTSIIKLNSWNGSAWEFTPNVVYALGNTLWTAPPGGSATPIATADTSIDGLWTGPIPLDAKTIAFRISSKGSTPQNPRSFLGLVDAGGRSVTRLPIDMLSIVGYADGVLVLGRRDGSLVAVPFDLAARRAIGEPVTVLDNVASKGPGGAMAALSDNGTLAYLAGRDERVMEVRDEHGVVTSTLPETRGYSSPAWSPDGQRIAMKIADARTGDVWVYDLPTRVLSRITSMRASGPVWTHDGKRLLFVHSELPRGSTLWWTAADGSGQPTRVPGSEALAPRTIATASITPDGKYAVLRMVGEKTDSANTSLVFALPLDGGKLIPLHIAEGGSSKAAGPVVSPNGKWVAYYSGPNGLPEVYVQPFPGGEGRVQISASGGMEPRWSPDGRRLFYTRGGALRAAVLDISGPLPRVTRTDSLFADAIGTTGLRDYDVHPDGHHFVMMKDAGGGPKIVVITNWLSEVKAKLGMK
jgi:eukaryotic-like serine/threonine-protein kinase